MRGVPRPLVSAFVVASATTRPGLTKIHHSFFFYVNDEGRGLLELRSLSGSLRIACYDLACAPGPQPGASAPGDG